MLGSTFYRRINKLIKEHWTHCPLPALIVLGWALLPVLGKLMVLGFAILVFLYDLIPWHYKKWRDRDVRAYQRFWAKALHLTVSLILLIPPIMYILTYEIRHWLPIGVDQAVLSVAATPTVTNTVPSFNFGVGHPHPTNYLTAFVATANASGANLFEAKPFLEQASSGFVGVVAAAGAWCLLAGVLGMFLVGLYEAITESSAKMERRMRTKSQ